MKSEAALAVFEGFKIRRIYDEATETWFFSVVDVVAALTESVNPRDYWFKMKIRVHSEDGVELSTICRQLKLKAPDGKMRETDCADVEALFRIIQSIPSAKAEPFKQWLAKVGYERIQDMSDPARSLDRARDFWRQHGRSEKWIQQRMMGQETRNKLTEGARGRVLTFDISGFAHDCAELERAGLPTSAKTFFRASNVCKIIFPAGGRTSSIRHSTGMSL